MKRQRMRRLLALVLTLTMVFTLVPGAYAQGGEENTGLTWKQVDNSAVSASLGREEVKEPEEAPLYEEDEQVRVSIVLEGEPTLALFSLASEDGEEEDAMAYREELQAYQDAAAEYISEEALDNEPLDVVWNLTLAANIISANVEFGRIEAIKDVDGVADVIVEQRYDILGFPVPDDPNMVISTGMTNTANVWNSGYTGAGMRIAIIDTGLDIEHQSFNNDAFLHALEEDAAKDGVEVSSYDLLDAEEIGGVLGQLNAAGKMSGVTADELYHNEKLPFCFSYIDNDLDVTHENDTQGEHGSHVAGIAAANRYLEKEDGSFVSAMDEVKMTGNAPDAQVLVMKVFGNGGGAYDSDYMVAIEDAIVLGCDTVNLSLGGGMGTTAHDNAQYQAIMENLANTDTVVSISAGNSYYWTNFSDGAPLPYSDDVSFHTSGSPGTYTNSLGVASVDNNGMVSAGFISAYSRTIGYSESSGSNRPLTTLDVSENGGGTELDFVYIDAVGTAEEFAKVDVRGKIALCNRGEINFTEKGNNGAAAGASAVIVCNNVEGTINMSTDGYTYTAPYVSITLADALFLKANAEKSTVAGMDVYTGKITIVGGLAEIPGGNDYETMSDFSSWGVPGDLTMKPEITAPGGNIWSLNGAHRGDGAHTSHEAYESMSGTSMAAPQMAGIGALVKQYIENRGLSAKTDITDRALAQSLMMSTATPLKDADGNYYSILNQGAGLVNTQAAVNADSYILMGSDATASYADGKVKVELGDDPGRTGSYDFTFTINNLENVPLKYTLGVDAFTQGITTDGTNLYLDTVTTPLNAELLWNVKSAVSGAGGSKYDFDGNGVVDLDDGNALLDVATGVRESVFHQDEAYFGQDSITSYNGHLFLQKISADGDTVMVPANGSVTISASIELDQAEMAELMEYCPNGAYVEAYVFVDTVANEEGALGTSHSIPVLGYYGNWSDSSMFDKGSYVEYSYGLENRAPYLFDGTNASLFRNTLTVQYAGDSGNYYFGGNPYVAEEEYLPERNALNNENGDRLAKWFFTAIRNAGASRLMIRDAETGEAYAEAYLGAADGAYYFVNGQTWRNTGYTLNVNWTGTDAEGNPLAEGTTVELSLTLAPELYVQADGSVDWDALGEGASQTMQVTIDNTAPKLLDAKYNAADKTLRVSAVDNQYVAAVRMYTADGSKLLAYNTPNQTVRGIETDTLLNLEDALGTKFLLAVYDYAGNISTYEFEETISSGIDAAFYGYDLTYGETGGWAGYTENFASSARVGYGVGDDTSIIAGTYAKGYVFAFDDDLNFYVFDASEPTALGDAQWIAYEAELCFDWDGVTIPGKVYDMAYDKTNDLMYLSYYAGPENVNKLGTIDLGTGEITEIAVVRETANGETHDVQALTVSGDGEIYAMLITGDVWKMDVEGSNVTHTLLGNIGAETVPNGICSMAWDSTSETLIVTTSGIWGGGRGIYRFDPNSGDSEKIADNEDSIAALFTASDITNDRLPAAADALSVTLSEESLTLLKGDSARLSAAVAPWNLDNRSVTWSSSDESVATVREGVVTAVGLGEATITAASAATPAVIAECEISVITIEEQLQALVWDENGEVWWSSFNTGDLPNYTKRMASQVRLASAAKGSDGYIYSATMSDDNASSDVYRVDPETMEAALIGTFAGGLAPVSDMVTSPANDGELFFVCGIPGLVDMEGSGWDLSNAYGSAGYIGIANLGPDEEGWDTYCLLDEEGKIRFVWLSPEGKLALSDGYMDTGIASSDTYFHSLTYAYDENDVPYLFWSRWTGESGNLSELIAIDIDNGTGICNRLGDFGAGVWPVGGLMSEEIPGLPESISSLRHSGDIEFAGERQELFASNEDEPAENEDVPADMDAPEAMELSADLETLSASVTSDSGTASVDRKGRVTVKVKLDEASTNGIIEASYNTRDLELVSVNGKATLNSANTSEDGKVILAYAYKRAAKSGTAVAELVFDSRNKADTTVTLTQTEDGTQTGLSTETKVSIVMPDDPYYPGGGGGSSGGGSKPSKPAEPTEPTEPTEPETPAPSAGINVPAAPSAEQVPEIVAPYTDVQGDDWYAEYAAYMINSGLMSGTSADSFSPNASLTRGMLVTILHRAAGLPAAGTAPFDDVNAGDWYANGVAWASALGVVTGYNDGTFAPNGNITRQELAVILWRFAQKLGISVAADGTTMPDFADRGEIASWAGEAMSWAYRTGILTGRNGNLLAPTDGATRAEAAAMLTRFLKLVENSQSPKQ